MPRRCFTIASRTPLATFEYDARGRRSKLTRGDGTSTTYGLSDTSALSSLTMALAGNSSYQVAGFTRDGAGQITNRSSSNSAFEAAAPTTSSTTSYENNGLNQAIKAAGQDVDYETGPYGLRHVELGART